MDTLDLLLHPVRLRIVYAMSGQQTRTTADLCARLSDIPKTSVYRHVGLLADAGVLEVVEERRVHGAVERHYRLQQRRAGIDEEMASAMSLDDHREAFATGAAVMLAEFNAYLHRDDADPTADKVSYRQFPIWLSHDELTELIEILGKTLMAAVRNEARPDRRPYLVNTILFPTGDQPAD